jgi:AcrR family transcriptional regulator
MATRLTREESKVETRKRLLAAARRVFLKHGFHGASLEQIAEEAGFSKGAVYSAFESKTDLYFALLDERIAERASEFARVAAEHKGVREFSEKFARRWMPRMRTEKDWFLLNMEVLVLSIRDPQLRREYVKRRRAVRDTFAELVTEAGLDHLPADASEIVLMGTALGNGIALEMMTDPERVPEGFYERVTTYLFRGMELEGRDR